jgi:uncharacterized protein YjbJ (UPF0337 family)
LRTHPFDGCVPTAEPGWTATPVTLSLAILFVARQAKKGDCGLLAADRVVGSAKKIKGSIKEVAGKTAGDAKLEAEGKADKIEGKVQNAVGGLKDMLKSTASTRGNQPAKNVACQRRSGNTAGSIDPLLNKQRTQFARFEYFSS